MNKNFKERLSVEYSETIVYYLWGRRCHISADNGCGSYHHLAKKGHNVKEGW